MVFKIGDIFFIKGKTIQSRFIRLLVSVRYGLRFRDSFSHIESGWTVEENISAEGSGTKIVKNDRKALHKADIEVYRIDKMDEEKRKKHLEEGKKYVGGGYAYSRYILDALRIIIFFMRSVSRMHFKFLSEY